ncbi:MAG: hydroxyacid dehydrogenase [Actinobacteria bacterium]|nr:hydroxyacid dehydrogenase [Actinomycetota bacterium]
MKALLAMAPEAFPFVFTDDDVRRLTGLVDIDPSQILTSFEQVAPGELGQVELLLTGWGAPALGARELDAMPNLRGVVHWGGGVAFLDAAAAQRGVAVSSARAANAIPVAEFTVAMIVLAAKDAFWASRRYSQQQRRIDREAELPHAGLYGTTVGIVGASSIGARVLKMLRGYDVEVLLFDPSVDEEGAALLGAELVRDLAELARRSTILSVHAPELPHLRGMISREVLAALPDRATVINTARGSLVDQEALVAELEAGRIRAILDVTDPDVLPPGHPLYTLPNVFLTPHLAGSMGSELRRLGSAATAEVARFVAGEPFQNPIIP